MRAWALFCALLWLTTSSAAAYPLYGSEGTGIKRLEQARLAHEGKLEGGRKKVSGELLSVEQVDLRQVENRYYRLARRRGEPSAELGDALRFVPAITAS